MSIFKLEQINKELEGLSKKLDPSIFNNEKVNADFLNEIKRIENTLTRMKVSKILFLMNDLEENKNKLIDLIGQNVVLSFGKSSMEELSLRVILEFPSFMKTTLLARNYGTNWGGVQLFKIAKNPLFEKKVVWIGESMGNQKTISVKEGMFLGWADVVGGGSKEKNSSVVDVVENVKKVIPEWLGQELGEGQMEVTFGNWMDLVGAKVKTIKGQFKEIHSLANLYLKSAGGSIENNSSEIEGIGNVMLRRTTLEPIVKKIVGEEISAVLEAYLLEGKCNFFEFESVMPGAGVDIERVLKPRKSL